MPEWLLFVAAVGAVLKSLIDSWKQNEKINTVVSATQQTVQIAKVIEGHVNSAATKADERARAGDERERRLQETIDELRRAAGLLAQAKAMAESPGPAQTTQPAAPEAIPLGSIKNLAARLEIKPKGTTGE